MTNWEQLLGCEALSILHYSSMHALSSLDRLLLLCLMSHNAPRYQLLVIKAIRPLLRLLEAVQPGIRHLFQAQPVFEVNIAGIIQNV